VIDDSYERIRSHMASLGWMMVVAA
jgi:hypothetical protein